MALLFYPRLLLNGNIGCNLGKFVAIVYWRKTRNFSKDIPKSFCICIAYIVHHLGNVFPGGFEEFLCSFNAHALKVLDWSVVGRFFESSFKCTPSDIDMIGQVFNCNFLLVFSLNIVLCMLDIQITMVALSSEYGELGLIIPAQNI